MLSNIIWGIIYIIIGLVGIVGFIALMKIDKKGAFKFIMYFIVSLIGCVAINSFVPNIFFKSLIIAFIISFIGVKDE